MDLTNDEFLVSHHKEDFQMVQQNWIDNISIVQLVV